MYFYFLAEIAHEIGVQTYDDEAATTQDGGIQTYDETQVCFSFLFGYVRMRIKISDGSGYSHWANGCSCSRPNF